MKKLFSVFFAIVALVAISACGSANADAVAEKISKGEALTQEDYTVATDYCVSMFDEMKPLIEKAVEAQSAGDTAKMEELEAEGNKIQEKYPHGEQFLQALMSADEEQLGKDNFEKIQKLFEGLFQLAM